MEDIGSVSVASSSTNLEKGDTEVLRSGSST